MSWAMCSGRSPACRLATRHSCIRLCTSSMNSLKCSRRLRRGRRAALEERVHHQRLAQPTPCMYAARRRDRREVARRRRRRRRRRAAAERPNHGRRPHPPPSLLTPVYIVPPPTGWRTRQTAALPLALGGRRRQRRRRRRLVRRELVVQPLQLLQRQLVRVLAQRARLHRRHVRRAGRAGHRTWDRSEAARPGRRRGAGAGASRARHCAHRAVNVKSQGASRGGLGILRAL